MAAKRQPAMNVAKWRTPSDLWIDHAHISTDDLKHLEAVEKLTLWNVTYTEELFACMPNLWWLDIRGGSASNFHSLPTANELRYLQINQIRGLRDLNDITSLEKLELLSLYGLSKVFEIPDLTKLSHLKRIEIGQMKALKDLVSVWRADQLEEILLIKDVPVETRDIVSINRMPNLSAFGWEAMDVPARRFMPIRTGVTIPEASAMHAADWFKQQSE